MLEPRLVKTPGTITNPDGSPTGYPEDIWDTSVYQLAYGLEFNQNTLPDDVVFPQIPLDIYYSRTKDKGQRYESVIVTPQGGSGKPQEGWNPLAKDKPAAGCGPAPPDPGRLADVRHLAGGRRQRAATSCSAGSTIATPELAIRSARSRGGPRRKRGPLYELLRKRNDRL